MDLLEQANRLARIRGVSERVRWHYADLTDLPSGALSRGVFSNDAISERPATVVMYMEWCRDCSGFGRSVTKGTPRFNPLLGRMIAPTMCLQYTKVSGIETRM